MTLDLQSQAVGWVWPAGLGLLTSVPGTSRGRKTKKEPQQGGMGSKELQKYSLDLIL